MLTCQVISNNPNKFFIARWRMNWPLVSGHLWNLDGTHVLTRLVTLSADHRCSSTILFSNVVKSCTPCYVGSTFAGWWLVKSFCSSFFQVCKFAMKHGYEFALRMIHTANTGTCLHGHCAPGILGRGEPRTNKPTWIVWNLLRIIKVVGIILSFWLASTSGGSILVFLSGPGTDLLLGSNFWRETVDLRVT